MATDVDNDDDDGDDDDDDEDDGDDGDDDDGDVLTTLRYWDCMHCAPWTAPWTAYGPKSMR